MISPVSLRILICYLFPSAPQSLPILRLEPTMSYLSPGESVTVDCSSSAGSHVPVTWERMGGSPLPYNFRVMSIDRLFRMFHYIKPLPFLYNYSKTETDCSFRALLKLTPESIPVFAELTKDCSTFRTSICKSVREGSRSHRELLRWNLLFVVQR